MKTFFLFSETMALTIVMLMHVYECLHTSLLHTSDQMAIQAKVCQWKITVYSLT